MQPGPVIKQQIIDVADIRFRRYGFGKTTMAEIAKDCRMSAANLYRYFESKEEIGVEIALKCLHDKENVGRAVLQRKDLSAGERLKVFFLEILNYTYKLCQDDPHLLELVSFISEAHPEVVDRHQGSLRAFVAEILAEGNRDGEFEVEDVVATAGTLLIAMIHFYYPPLVMMKNRSLETLEAALEAVLSLTIEGLSKR